MQRKNHSSNFTTYFSVATSGNLSGVRQRLAAAVRSALNPQAKFEPLETRRMLSTSYPAGTLDDSFNTTGIVNTSISGANDEAVGTAVQSDGNILLVGNSADNGTIELASYTTNGSLDSSFGSHGIVTTSASGSLEASGVAIDGSGDIYVSATEFVSGSGYEITVAKYDTSGNPVAGFGSSGIATIINSGGTKAGFGQAIAIDPTTGNVVVTGYGVTTANRDEIAIATLNPVTGAVVNQTLTAVGASGNAQANSVVIQSVNGANEYVVGGYATVGGNEEFALARYTSSLSLDSTFGSGGIATNSLSSGAETSSLAIGTDGTIFAAGAAGGYAALENFSASGAFLTSYVASGSGFAQANGIAIQYDGKILLTGYTFNGTNNSVELERLIKGNTGALTPDSTFGTAGEVTTSYGGTVNAQANAVVIDSDRAIIAGTASVGSGANPEEFTAARYQLNSPPTISSATVSLNATDELSTSNNLPVNGSGTQVATLLEQSALNYSDPDPQALQGMAITSVDNSNGQWYSSLNGSAWTAINDGSTAGTVSATNALLLPASAYVQFVPNPYFNTDPNSATHGPTPTMTFYAWDQTSGSSGGYANPTLPNSTATDGYDSYSGNTATADAAVNSVNQPTPSTVYVNASWAGSTTDEYLGTVGSTNEYFGVNAFATIQSGVNAVASGGTVHVAAGVYTGANVVDATDGVEAAVQINKSISLIGPNPNFNASGAVPASASQAIILPGFSDPYVTDSTESVGIEITASDVTVQGLTFDGSNAALAHDGNITLNSLPIDEAEGVVSYRGVGNITVSNNIIENTAYSGVDFYNSDNTDATSDNTISSNLIQNLSDAYGFGVGVLLYNDFYAQVTNNVINNVTVGVQSGNFSQANSDGSFSPEISNNKISASAIGIFFNLMYGSTSTFTVADNAISAIDSPSDAPWQGVLIGSIQSAVGVTFQGNTIDGSAAYTSMADPSAGYDVWNTPTTGTVVIGGGSVSGVDYGVWVNSYEGYNGIADATQATISDVNITASQIGVYVEDSPQNTNHVAVSATVNDDTEITTDGTGTGILVSGANASADINDNDDSIYGNAIGIDVNGGTATITNDHIYDNTTGISIENGGSATVTGDNFNGSTPNITDLLIQSNASSSAIIGGTLTGDNFAGSSYFIQLGTGQNLDATGATFNGLSAANSTLAANYSTEDKTVDYLDYPSLGYVSINPDVVYVAYSSEQATPGAVQRGINVANSGDTVNVQAGTYVANLTITTEITLSGANSAVDPNTATRGDESILLPAVDDTSLTDAPGDQQAGANPVIHVSGDASGTTITGFTVDGLNTALNSLLDNPPGTIDASTGIYLDQVSGVTIENNIVQHFVHFAITGIAGSNGLPVSTGSAISDNQISNVEGQPNYGYGEGVDLANNFYASIDGNYMTAVRRGMDITNFYLANTGAEPTVSGNHVDAGQIGIWLNLFYESATGFDISGNTLTASFTSEIFGPSPDANHAGLFFSSFTDIADGVLTVSDNNISGEYDAGVLFWNAVGSDVTVSGGTINETGGTVDGSGLGVAGVRLETSNTYYGASAAGLSTLTLDGVTIEGPPTGVAVTDNLGSPGTSIQAVIEDNTDITTGGAGTGVSISGSGASAIISNNDDSIYGNAIGIDVNGGTATITNDHIYDNTTGISIENGGSATVTGDNFNGSTPNITDLLIQSNASSSAIIGGVLTGDNFAGSSYFIKLGTSQNLDATGATFNGLSAANSTLAANYSTEDKIIDYLDYPSLGYVSINPDVVYVAYSSEQATPDSLQRAVNAATAGVTTTIDVQAGTYEDGNNNDTVVDIDKAVTLMATDGADVTTINGNSTGNDYYVVTISSSNAALEDFTVTNPIYSGTADASGVLVEPNDGSSSLTNVTVSGNIIHDIGALTRPVASFGTFGINVEDNEDITDVDVINSNFNDNTIYNIGNADDNVNDNPGAFGILTAGDGNDIANDAFDGNTIYNVVNPYLPTGIYIFGSRDITIDNNIIGVAPNGYAGPVDTGTGISTDPSDLGTIAIGGNEIENQSVAAIQLNSPDAETVSQNTISNSTVGLEVDSGAVLTSATQNYFTDNGTGVLIESGAASVGPININSISGNTTAGLENDSAITVDASQNWWGSSNGPTTPLNTFASSGTGDKVIGTDVIIAPWLTDGTDSQPNTPGFQHVPASSAAPAAPAALAVLASDDSGASDSDGITNVTDPHITGSSSAADSGDTVTLYNGSTVLGTGTVGSNGSWEVPSSALPDGQYSLTAIITDDNGVQSASSTGLTVYIVTQAPVASINDVSSDYPSHPAGTTISLDSAFTQSPVLPNGSPITYAWTVTYNHAVIASATTQNYSFVPDDSGTYYVSLTVTDVAGNSSAPVIDPITVSDVAPVASISAAPATNPAGTEIELTGSASDVASGDNAEGYTFSWTVTKNGNPFASGSTNTLSPTTPIDFTPDDQGTFVVTLIATDHNNVSSAPVQETISVSHVAPTLTLSGDSSVSEGSTYTLTLSSSDPGSDPLQSWTVNWGDGESSVVTVPSNAITYNPMTHLYVSSVTATHVYVNNPSFLNNGTVANYTITATATDTDGTYNAGNSQPVAVDYVPPTVLLSDTVNNEPVEGSPYTLDIGPLVDPGGAGDADHTGVTTSEYVVNWGDGATTTISGSALASMITNGGTATHTYMEGPHAYQITLDILDSNGYHPAAESGNTVTAGGVLNVTVQNVPPTAMFSGSSTLQEGSNGSVTFFDQYSPSAPALAAGFTYEVDVVDSSHTMVLHQVQIIGQEPGNANSPVTVAIPSADLQVGNNVIRGTITDRDGGSSSYYLTINVTGGTFQVTGFTPTSSGFAVTFNDPVDLATLHLYGSAGGFGNVPDVTVVGSNTGPVTGSLVWNAQTDTAYFIKTGGPLLPDTYSVTLVSGANGWENTSNQPLDGTDSGGDSNYVTTFVAAYSTSEPTLTLPDFARGPGQAVDIPVSGTSLPIQLSNANGVYSVDFHLVYNPALLNISSAALNTSALPAGWTLTSNFAGPGQINFTASGVTAISTNALFTLINLTASVPNNAPYASAADLQVQDLAVNGGNLPSISNSALEKVAYLGDTAGLGRITGTDASLISRVVVGLDSGFNAYPLTDPVIIGNVSGTGTLNGLDAAYVAQASIGLAPGVNYVPAIPHGITLVTGGIDPTISVPADSLAARGGSLTLPITISDLTNYIGSNFAFIYNPALLNLTQTSLSLDPNSPVTSADWAVLFNPANGEAVVYQTNPGTPLTGPATLADLTVSVPATVGPNELALQVGGEASDVSATGGTLSFSYNSGNILITPVFTGKYYILALDGQGNVDVWENVPETSTPTYVFPESLYSQPGFNQLTFNTTAAGGSVTVDASNGNPLPAGGLVFNASAGGNTLTVDGGNSGSNLFGLSSTGDSFDGDALSVSDVQSVVFNGGTADNTLTQYSQPTSTVVFNGDGGTNDLIVDGGTFTFAAAAPGTGITALNWDSIAIATGAKVVVAQPDTASDRQVLIVDHLSIAGIAGAWTGSLDLSGNDMIVPNGNLTTITSLLASGYNAGAGYWNGTGISSSAAATNSTFLTALGVELNDNGMGQPLFGNGAPLGLFDGQSPSAGDVLIKYTYYGDANLDGKVDASDYSRIDSGYLSGLAGWANGDFNYDGTINGSDYTLIDNAFNMQGAGFSDSIAWAAAPSALSVTPSALNAAPSALSSTPSQPKAALTAVIPSQPLTPLPQSLNDAVTRKAAQELIVATTSAVPTQSQSSVGPLPSLFASTAPLVLGNLGQGSDNDSQDQLKDSVSDLFADDGLNVIT